ncbi:MAG TPA: hypothetical protein VL422_08020 [Miltoncostaea sp.]|nr:hypothetical protein [Miltoncostaea sp.]
MEERTLTTDDLAEGRTQPAAVEEEQATTTAAEGDGATDTGRPLFDDAEGSELRDRWGSIQTGFVDEPRRAVEEADALVADLMTRLAQSFSEERKGLEGQWDRGDDVSTEDLRIALQRYRTFFDRLLAA